MADYNSSYTGAQIDAAITKVGGIEAGADVTDTANVTAAGALMDSEVTNLADVKAFDPVDYATAAQGALADSAQQPPAEGAFVDGDKTKLDGIEAGAEVNTVDSDPTGVTGADAITNIISLTTAEYGAITPDAATLYVIKD